MKRTFFAFSLLAAVSCQALVTNPVAWTLTLDTNGVVTAPASFLSTNRFMIATNFFVQGGASNHWDPSTMTLTISTNAATVQALTGYLAKASFTVVNGTNNYFDGTNTLTISTNLPNALLKTGDTMTGSLTNRGSVKVITTVYTQDTNVIVTTGSGVYIDGAVFTWQGTYYEDVTGTWRIYDYGGLWSIEEIGGGSMYNISGGPVGQYDPNGFSPAPFAAYGTNATPAPAVTIATGSVEAVSFHGSGFYLTNIPAGSLRFTNAYTAGDVPSTTDGTNWFWKTVSGGAGQSAALRIGLPAAVGDNPGSTNDATVILISGTNVNYSEAQFSDTQEQRWRAIIPGSATRALQSGSITNRIVWRSTLTSTNCVVWSVAMRTLDAGGLVDASYNAEKYITNAPSTTANGIVLSDIVFSPGTNEMKAGQATLIELRRKAADANDVSAAAARLLSLEIFQ